MKARMLSVMISGSELMCAKCSFQFAGECGFTLAALRVPPDWIILTETVEKLV